jgi:hypothetical protein
VAKRLHESFVSLGPLYAGGCLTLFRQGRRKPEANKKGDGLDGNPNIAF